MNYDARIDTASPGGADGTVTAYADPLDDGSEQARRDKRRMWLFLAIAAVLLTGIWFWMHRDDKSAAADSKASQVPLVTVVTPGRTTVAGKISSTGTLAARREMPVGVAGEGGQVVRVLVEPGQWVGAGQTLAVIDRSVQTQQSASLAAQIQVTQADARLAQANLDRATALVAKGFVSKADVDRLTATRDAANARVRVARASLGELQARTNRLNIVAPAGGLVLERRVEPGQVVGVGSGVLFNLAKGGEMELLARLSETDLAAIAPGTSVIVTPVGSQRSFNGQVWQISPVIDPQTRQGIARVAIAYAPELRPGGFASAEIVSGTVVAPVLPESAILSDDKGSYVYLVGKDRKVVRRNVSTGVVSADGIAIVDGLDGSEQVVLRAGAFLSPGETVQVKRATGS